MLFNRIPFRHSILFLIAALLLLVQLVNFTLLKPQLIDLLDTHARQDMSVTLNRLQGSIESYLRNQNFDEIRREVASNSSHSRVKQLVVLNPKQQIIASGRLGDLGKPVDSLPLHFDLSVLQQVTQTQVATQVLVKEGEASLYGIAPIQFLASGRLREVSTGLLILEYDLKPWQSEYLNKLDEILLWLSLVGALMGGVFWLLFKAAFEQRIQSLVNACDALAEGRFDVQAESPGEDEFKHIAVTINQMAQQIESTLKALHISNEQKESILRNIPAMVYIKSINGQYLLVNERFKAAFPEIRVGDGKTIYDIIPRAEADKFSQFDAEVLATGESQTRTLSFTHANRERVLNVVKFPLFDEQQQPYAVCSVAMDLTEQEQTENLLNISRGIFENTAQAILITDHKKNILDVNRAFERITGYTKREAVGKPPSFLASGKTPEAVYETMWKHLGEHRHWSGELFNQRKNGELYVERIAINAIVDKKGRVTGFIGIFQDVTQEKRANENLQKLAFSDSLTGLFNREAFKAKLEESIAYGQRYTSEFGILFIDLDLFKEVNDTHGHEYGDRLLRKVAERIRTCTRETDIISRLGGDEFTVLVRGHISESGLAVLANQIIKALSEPFMVSDTQVGIGCSIGIAIYPKDGGDKEQLLKHADAAMYHAKELGRGCFSFFDISINQRNQRLIAIKQALRQAIKAQEFRLVYQPKVDPKRHQVTGYEALLRWHSAVLGEVSPAEFIPLAEQSGFIEQITQWVIYAVARDKREIPELAATKVAINISAKQFGQEKWVKTLAALHRRGRMDATGIIVEVTETALVESFDKTLEQLKSIRRLGIEIAIDDFGTGYSSLAYLKKMPIQTLKIDRDFVKDISHDSDDRAIVEAVITMAKALGVKVVAEGAESAEQVAFLLEHGCEEIQGYFYARPLERKQLAQFRLHA